MRGRRAITALLAFGSIVPTALVGAQATSTQIADWVLGLSSANPVEYDLNGDAEVDVADVIDAVNMGQVAGRQNEPMQLLSYSVDTLTVSPESTLSDQIDLAVRGSSGAGIAGMQLFVRYDPAKIALTDVTRGPMIGSTFLLRRNEIAVSTAVRELRVICYNVPTNTFAPAGGTALTLHFTRQAGFVRGQSTPISVRRQLGPGTRFATVFGSQIHVYSFADGAVRLLSAGHVSPEAAIVSAEATVPIHAWWTDGTPGQITWSLRDASGAPLTDPAFGSLSAVTGIDTVYIAPESAPPASPIFVNASPESSLHTDASARVYVISSAVSEEADVDGDGAVSDGDSSLAAEQVLSTLALPPDLAARADTNDDGVIDASDIVGIVNLHPVPGKSSPNTP